MRCNTWTRYDNRSDCNEADVGFRADRGSKGSQGDIQYGLCRRGYVVNGRNDKREKGLEGGNLCKNKKRKWLWKKQ